MVYVVLVWRHDYYSTISGGAFLVGLYFYQRHRRIKRDGPYNKPRQTVPA